MKKLLRPKIIKLSVFSLGFVVIMASALHQVHAAEVSPLLGYYSNDYWLLLGGSAHGKWLAPKEVAPRLAGRENYRVYTLGGPVGQTTGGKPGPWGDVDPEFLIRLKPVLKIKGPAVAVGGRWNAMPRQPRLLTDNPKPHSEAAAEILKSQGIPDPKVKLTQVIEVDLEGDGTKEVVVSATRFSKTEPGDSTQIGDYSLVFLQKKVGGVMSNMLIAGQFHTPGQTAASPASTYRVGGLIDGNGDGVMEIVVIYTYYEGGGMRVYKLKEDQVEMVLGEDWGA